MENNRIAEAAPPASKFRFGCLHVLVIMAAVILATALLTAWWVKHNIYASNFTPTKLSSKDQEILNSKLALLGEPGKDRESYPLDKSHDRMPALEPERYTEKGARREISLTEKELNALIANKPEVARRVAIKLSDDMVSVKLVVPMDEEILFLGGKTLRLSMGVTLGYENSRPMVALQGVTLGGIPLPNAWLGNLKYKNLVDEFGTEQGFWKLFSDGVQDIQVKEGRILIKLKE